MTTQKKRYPTYQVMITRALSVLVNRSEPYASRVSILKWIAANFPIPDHLLNRNLSQGLKRAVANGVIEQRKLSYRLTAKGKKSPRKKSSRKKSPPKKSLPAVRAVFVLFDNDSYQKPEIEGIYNRLRKALVEVINLISGRIEVEVEGLVYLKEEMENLMKSANKYQKLMTLNTKRSSKENIFVKSYGKALDNIGDVWSIERHVIK